MKYLLSILLMLSASVGATSLTLGLSTNHFGENNYNNDNDLVMLEHSGLFVTTFMNSYNRRSVAAGYKLERGTILKYGAYVGVSSGYCFAETVLYHLDRLTDYNTSTCEDIGFPVVAPFVSVGSGNIDLSITVFGQAVITGITLGV